MSANVGRNSEEYFAVDHDLFFASLITNNSSICHQWFGLIERRGRRLFFSELCNVFIMQKIDQFFEASCIHTIHIRMRINIRRIISVTYTCLYMNYRRMTIYCHMHAFPCGNRVVRKCRKLDEGARISRHARARSWWKLQYTSTSETLSAAGPLYLSPWHKWHTWMMYVYICLCIYVWIFMRRCVLRAYILARKFDSYLIAISWILLKLIYYQLLRSNALFIKMSYSLL